MDRIMTCFTPVFAAMWDIEYLFECHKRRADVEENNNGCKN